MNLVKPKKLKQGDCIGLLSVCGCVEDEEKLKEAVSFFEARGFNVKLQSPQAKCVDYLSGSDKERKESLESYFKDGEIDAIVLVRGGYGAIRIVKDIDYSLIRSNPKIFVGYSDATAFLAMFYKHSGLVCFHGPMALSDFVVHSSEFTEKCFFDVLTDNVSQIFSANVEAKVFQSGTAEGVLFGGNLSTLASLCGLDFVPNEKFVLFIEDLNEPVYKIDKMLTQLLNLDNFKHNISGLILGEFINVDSQKSLEDYFLRLSEKLDIPMCSGFKITHGADKITLPIGVRCKLDADKCEIAILEGCFDD